MAQEGEQQQKIEQPQKIYIESQELEIDETNGVSEYRGDVSFTRGGVHLTADRARLFEKEGKLQKLLAWGQPVHLRQQLTDARGETRAVASRMEYLAEDDRLFLYGEAHLWQDGNEFSGDVIEYHLSEEKVIARGDQSQSGRVHIVIEPTSPDDKPGAAVPGGPVASPEAPAETAPVEQQPDDVPRPDKDQR
jgi:lipopolysaccharide export system protein LptA